MRYDHILVTGATGAVGAELLGRLLSGPRPSRVTVLIRGDIDADVRTRFASFVGKLRSRHPHVDVSSLSPVRGDVTRPHLGLTPSTREALTASVDAVVHSAADTRLGQSRASAQVTNRVGTTRVLDFASACRRLRRLLHVSTAYVSGSRVGRIEETELDRGQSFLNPYEASKFDAETDVRARMAHLPVTVARPSIVVGDSRDGHAFTTSAILPVLRQVASGRMRDFPGWGSTRLDLVPVDYVANALHLLLLEPRALGGTFHLVAGEERSIAARRLFELTIQDVGHHAGRHLTFSGRPESADGHARASDHLRCYLDYLLYDKAFDDAGLRALAGTWIPPCPHAETFLPAVLHAAFRGRRARVHRGGDGRRAAREPAMPGTP